MGISSPNMERKNEGRQMSWKNKLMLPQVGDKVKFNSTSDIGNSILIDVEWVSDILPQRMIQHGKIDLKDNINIGEIVYLHEINSVQYYVIQTTSNDDRPLRLGYKRNAFEVL